MWIDARGSTVLPTPECQRLLAVAAKDGGVGRLGVPTAQAPIVLPVNFALQDRNVVTRVGSGLSRSADGRLVAFEVDHVDPAAGVAWSVLARGLATLVEHPDDGELAAAHPFVPEPGGMVLVVRPDVLTGRRFTFDPART
jgi:hypothetical protein